jgi:hypothetical protein
MPLMATALLAFGLAQAATAETPQPAAATVSGVVVTSPKAKAAPKVYTPTYKAAPHLAPPSPHISGSTTIDQVFSNDRFRTGSLSSMQVSQLAAQRYRAKKAADLINAGHCPEALQAVFNEGDTQLTLRVAEVCGLPSPMEQAKGPPF